MKQYTKKHSKKEAAHDHAKKIKARGGTASVEFKYPAYVVSYSFPSKSKSGKKTEKLYNIIAVNKKTGEEHIEEYDFNAMDAKTWIHNNAKSQPSYRFKTQVA